MKVIQFSSEYLNLMAEQAPDLQVAEQDRLSLMEQILDRLKLLNYEKEFLKARGLKPLNPMYFAVQTTPVQQFNYFKNLVKWLLQVNDVQGSDFSKYDDPMTVSTNIITECKKLGIQCDYPPMKLRTGSGDEVLIILHQLTAKAMKKVNFAFKKPKLEAANVDEPEKDETGGGNDPDMQDEVEDVEVEEDDDFDQNDQPSKVEVNPEREVIQSNIPEKDWLIECEKVASKLKITAKPDNKEWRAHVESTRLCGETIKKSIPDSRTKLERLGDDLTKTLEKIFKSEKVINSNMSDVGAQYRTKSEDYKKLSTHYNNLNVSIKQMGENYRVVSQKLETLTLKTQEHSGTMTDSSPVVKIKASIAKLVSEIKGVDVRIGVMNHSVLLYRTKEKRIDENGGELNGMHAIEEFDD